MNLYDGMDKCPEDWHDVFVKTANILVRTYRNKVGNVYFHRGSKFMQKIYEAKAEVMKADKRSDNVQALVHLVMISGILVIYGCQLMAQQNTL